jgi:nitrite reductase (NADH) small subunit
LQVRDGWTAVCRGDDIVSNTGVCVLINGKQIAVFKLEDESVYAIDNLDPFSGASVLSRGIVGDLKGEVVVASPVYKQHFSLKSGQCVEEQDVKIAVYPARVENEMIWVSA